MPEILIQVKNKEPKIVGNIETAVSDNSDYTIRFMFDEQWEDSPKTVYFVRSNGFAFAPAKTVDDTVAIPIQNDVGVLSRLYVGVQQGDVKTSQACEIILRPSVAECIDDNAVQPEPDMWQDVMRRLEDLEESGGGTGGGITAETDPTVPAWAKQPTKPSYTAAEVGLGNVTNERQYSANNQPPYPVTSVNGRTGAVNLGAADVGARPSTWTPTASDVGALPAETKVPAKTSDLTNDSGFITIAVATLLNYYLKSEVYSKLETYNAAEVDNLISGINSRLNAIADSDDETLDQLSEIVAYIKANKSLIDSITTSKVSVVDIVDNLVTSAANKPLSAAQGVALKRLIDSLSTTKLDADRLNEAINTALAQAKESGEFDGDKGDKGDTGEPGPKGDKGDTGAQGADGLNGLAIYAYSFDMSHYNTVSPPEGEYDGIYIVSLGTRTLQVGDLLVDSVGNVYRVTVTYPKYKSFDAAYVTNIHGADGKDGSDGKNGADGNGIASAVLNADYTLTLTFTDGTSYTTPSIRGATGAAGANGKDYVLTDTDKTEIAGMVKDLLSKETWTFTLADGTTVEKVVPLL